MAVKEAYNKTRSALGYLNVLAVRQKLHDLQASNVALKKQLAKLKKLSWIEPGHFYSPITHSIDFEHFNKRDFIPGIDLNTKEQLANLKLLSKFYTEQPFSQEPTGDTRYYFNNDQFSYSDALALYLMLRHKKPQRIIEVGSGYSSALMLDVNNLFLNDTMKLTFIEPYPTRLKRLLKKNDSRVVEIIQKPVQKVPLSVFEQLKAGDILFIDSSHVAKTGSDVNWLYFEVLPRLKKGVIIHVHDVMYPFEYLDDWIKEGRSWNEIYLLKALLIENHRFKIIFWGNYLHKFHRKAIQTTLPLSKKNHGGSIWLERQ